MTHIPVSHKGHMQTNLRVNDYTVITLDFNNAIMEAMGRPTKLTLSCIQCWTNALLNTRPHFWF